MEDGNSCPAQQQNYLSLVEQGRSEDSSGLGEIIMDIVI